MGFRGKRKRENEEDLKRTPSLTDGKDTANNQEFPTKVRKMDSKKSGQVVLTDNKGTENSSFLKTVQNKWGRLVRNIRNRAHNILQKMGLRKRKRATVGPIGINNKRGNESVAGEEATGRKRKQRVDPSTIQDDISGECSGPSSKQIKTVVPLTVDRFMLHSILGEGTFGKVIMATDNIRKESVALKIIKKRSLISCTECLVEQQILMFTHNCKFLIHGYAAFHTENYAYLVTELASGGDLHEYICNSMPLKEPITFIAAEIICGLQFLHFYGIIHRDLKPNNILLTGDGHVKIADFGLALYEFDERFNTRNTVGTPGYRAPEMIMGCFYDAGVDWFAFGVILYNMILHKVPFPGDTIEEIERNVMYHQPSYGNLIDLAAIDIMWSLLSKDQSVRLGVNGNIRNHIFFSNINWADIESGKMTSPVTVRENMEVSMSQQISAPCSEDLNKPITAEEQRIFSTFPFVCPAWSTTYN